MSPEFEAELREVEVEEVVEDRVPELGFVISGIRNKENLTPDDPVIIELTARQDQTLEDLADWVSQYEFYYEASELEADQYVLDLDTAAIICNVDVTLLQTQASVLSIVIKKANEALETTRREAAEAAARQEKELADYRAQLDAVTFE